MKDDNVLSRGLVLLSNLKPLPILVWSLASAAMLAAMLGAATVWLSARIQKEEQSVRHTLTLQHQVSRILSLVQHVETNQRGYLLTGRGIYLDAYKEAERTLADVMDEASELVADDPQQRQAIARLRHVVAERLEDVHSTIDDQQAGHPDAARARVNSDHGLMLMEQIRQLVSEIRSAEDRSLGIREAASKFVGTLLQIGAATAFALICTIGMLVSLYIWRSFAELKGARDQLAVTNQRLIEEMQERERSKACLQLALDAARLGWWQYDPLYGAFSWDARSKDILDIAEKRTTTQEIMRLVHSDDAGQVWAAFETGCNTTDRNPRVIKFRVRWGASAVRWVKLQWLACLEGASERLVLGVVGTIEDITESMEHEEKTHLLMREINHRAKNMLSVVDSIAHQTAAKNPEDFIERFSDRIQALSANQDLLVSNEWDGVELADLVRAQVANFADLIGSRITVHDSKLRLNPAAAQAIGLALRELGSNAGKYGALSTDSGRVDINWGTDDDTFTLGWTERGGPAVSAPERYGFGTVVMVTMAERSLGGTVDLDYARSGVTWRLTCPIANVLEPGNDVT